LDTATAYEIQRSDALLPNNISTTRKFAHLCWDNFDINEETPSGSGTTHTTQGIVIQEEATLAVDVRTVSEEVTKKMRSFKYEPIHLRPCYAK
jgi:hypothetical protein